MKWKLENQVSIIDYSFYFNTNNFNMAIKNCAEVSHYLWDTKNDSIYSNSVKIVRIIKLIRNFSTNL